MANFRFDVRTGSQKYNIAPNQVMIYSIVYRLYCIDYTLPQFQYRTTGLAEGVQVYIIRHFAFENYYVYVLQNHVYNTYFESFNISFRYQANKTVSGNLCLIYMTQSLLRNMQWLKICLKHMISKQIKVSLTIKVSYFMDPRKLKRI